MWGINGIIFNYWIGARKYGRVNASIKLNQYIYITLFFKSYMTSSTLKNTNNWIVYISGNGTHESEIP